MAASGKHAVNGPRLARSTGGLSWPSRPPRPVTVFARMIWLAMPTIEALFLDLDQTLLDASRFGESITGTCEKIVEQAPGLDAVRLVEANGRVFARFGLESIDDWTLGRLSGQALSIEVWRRTLQECGATDAALVNFASTTHLQLARETYRLFDDARELIDAITDTPIPVALITNGASDTQRAKLAAMGIHDWFDVLVISGETGIAKPDPSAFAPAVDRLGITGATVWHVGDNLATDVAGANAAGLTSVWLNRHGIPNSQAIRPDLEIASLADLVGFIQ